MRTRAERRHHMDRAKGRARRYLSVIGFAATTKRVACFASDRTPCSCAMCGNPRRHCKGDEKTTRAERLAKVED